MIRVRMKVAISGTRDGKEWPDRGGYTTLPDQEAADYIAAGIVEPAPQLDASEFAVMPEAELRAGASGPSLAGDNAGRRPAAPGPDTPASPGNAVKHAESSPITTETGPTRGKRG
jgi:hypothetical protein